MAAPHYVLTKSGILYAVHSASLSDMQKLLLFYIKNYGLTSFSLNDIKQYFGGDNISAVKAVYQLMNKGWIDVDDYMEEVISTRAGVYDEIQSLAGQKTLLVDNCGLSVVYTDFDKRDADCLAAVVCSYIQTAQKSRILSNMDSCQPISMTIEWKGVPFVVYQLCIGSVWFGFACTDDVKVQERLFHVISCLVRRYYDA